MFFSFENEQAQRLTALVKQLMDPDLGVRQKAADTLQAMGPEVLASAPAMIQHLNRNSGCTKAEAIQALDLIEPGAMEAIIAIVSARVPNQDEARSEIDQAFKKLRRAFV